jgi:spore coat protein U-like protein
VFLNAGQDNAISPRVLANGTARLSYQIYSDTSRTLVLGPGNNQYYEAQVTLSGGGTATVAGPSLRTRDRKPDRPGRGTYTSAMGGRAVTDTNTGSLVQFGQWHQPSRSS